MPYKVATTNEPDVLKTVSDEEYVDLTRMGLIEPGRGDVNADGRLKRTVTADAGPDVLNASPNPALTGQPVDDTKAPTS